MAPLLWRSPHLLFLSLMGPLPLPLPHSPFLLHPFFPLLTSLTHRPPLRLLLPPPLPSPAPSFLLPHTAPYPRPRKRRSLSPSPSPSPSPQHHSDTSWDDDWSTKDDDLLLSLKCNERLRPSWRYITTKMQRPESQIRAWWAELLELQRLATS